MERTTPHLTSDPISLFMRTYYSLLRTTDAVPIQSLIESYIAMNSSLHISAIEDETDISALIYGALRMPDCIAQVDTILLGQTDDIFEKYGYDINGWERVSSPGRRRRMHWDGKNTLAVFLSSRSDMDDLIPILVAYQIEWNKLNLKLRNSLVTVLFNDHKYIATFRPQDVQALAREMNISPDELNRLATALGKGLIPLLKAMSTQRKHFRIRQLAGSLADYRKATGRWWANVRDCCDAVNYELEEAPVYFVSSNLHALANLLTGFAVREREQMLEFLHQASQEDLLEEYENMQSNDELALNEPNFFYYAAKKYLKGQGQQGEMRKKEAEGQIGMLEVSSRKGFDVGAQIFPLWKLQTALFDPRLNDIPGIELLANSNAYIMNIDYPLGLSAYELLSHVSSRVGRLAGVYIMGKAATLNGRVGDVMIPNVLHDEHSSNTYLFTNCFNASHLSPYMKRGSVLDNQKAITAFGTFLQNSQYMDIFYSEGYTILEMEGGPYLSAVYETVRPRRHPSNELVRLYEAALDVGLIYYASDTPLSKGHNLGASSLGYGGVEPTYAAAVAIMRRILQLEVGRLSREDRSLTRLMTSMDFASSESMT
jgi:hypothetical protein